MSVQGEMTFAELSDFIERRMKMSHVYQPLLIRSLLDAGGLATFRQLAQAFLGQDESQLLFYEKRIKEMPFKVLHKHGVVTREGELVRLVASRMTLEQKARIRMLCEQRMQEFVQKRGITIWDYRMFQDDPVPDSLRYQVLKACGGRCALCGRTKDEMPLEVDHIKPRSLGGTNDLENLQALCMECNRIKRNTDSTDFRTIVASDVDAGCTFCQRVSQKTVVEELRSVVAFEDERPVTAGHVLVVPRRHATDYFALSARERSDADDFLRLMRNRLAQRDPLVSGFNVKVNSGAAAGQMVLHAHIHLIPRRSGDSRHREGERVVPRASPQKL